MTKPFHRSADLQPILREITLVLGGVFAAFNADPAMVDSVTRCLADVFCEVLGDNDDGLGAPGFHPNLIPLLELVDAR